MITLAMLILGWLLDLVLGEPKSWHPLVGLGYWANWVERQLYGQSSACLRGAVAWCVVVGPLVAIAWWLDHVSGHGIFHLLLGAAGLYLALGAKSLRQHGQRVADPLLKGDLAGARQALAMIVSRDVSELDEEGIANAACESMLENGADAIFAALFWFAVLGLPGVVLYRSCNTLDAMWGYRSPRYQAFGYVAARMDDLLNLVPARLTALGYGLASGQWQRLKASLRCAYVQGRNWKSPNAGPVMAAGAAALGLTLGGVGIYHGVRQQRGTLGEGRAPRGGDIRRAIALVMRTQLIWLMVTALVVLMVTHGAVAVGQ